MANLGIMTAELRADTSHFNKSMERAQGRLKQTGASMRKAGSKMTMAVTAPLAAIGGLGLNVAMNFESAMNQVSAVSGATGRDLENLEGIARELGAKTKFSATEAAEGMNFLSMAGFSVKQTMSALPATLDLAAAANMRLGEGADIVSNVMQGFGRKAGRTRETVDLLTKTFTSSNTNLKQLGDAMSYVAPVAKGFGQSMESTAAAVGLLSNAGIQGTRAGTGLRRVLSILAKKSGELGVEVYNASGDMRPFVEILEDIEKQGLSSAEIMDLFGMRGGPVMQTLLARGSKALQDFTGDLSNAGGTAKDVAETQMKGMKGALTELKAAASEVAISFSEEFQGSVESLTDSVKGAAQWLGNLDSTTKRWILSITGIAAVIGPVLIGLGLMASAVGNISKAVRVMKVLLTSTTGLVGALVTVVAAATIGFIRHKNAVKNYNEVSKEMAEVTTAARQSIAKERGEVDRLISTLESEISSREQKVEALDELRSIAPEFFKDLKIEKGLLGDLRDRQEDYNEALMKGAKIEAYKDKLTELHKEMISLKEEGSDKSFWNILEAVGRAVSFDPMTAKDVAQEEYNQKLEQTEESIGRIRNALIQQGQALNMSTSAFAEQADRVGENSKLTLNLAGSIAKLQERLEEVKGRRIELALEGNPIPPRLIEMIEKYREKINELKNATDDPFNVDPGETAKKTYTDLKDKVTELEKAIRNRMATGVVTDEDFNQLTEWRNRVEYVDKAFKQLADSTSKSKISTALSEQIKRTSQDVDALMESLGEVDISLNLPDTMDSAKRYLKGVGMVGTAWDDLSDNVRANAKRILADENILADGSKEDAIAMAKRWESTMNRISSAVESAVEGILIGSAKMIGGLIAGTEKFGGFGNFILEQLGQLAIKVGTLLIGFGITLEKFLAGWASMNPFLVVAAGIALIAIGSAITGSISNAGGGDSGDVQGLATGGSVVKGGRFLVGEEGPEEVTLPAGAAVTPNKVLESRRERDYEERLVTNVSGKQIDIVLQRWLKEKGRIS